MSVINDIEYNKFLATDQMISQLAWEHSHAIDFGKRSRNTFMQILLALTQHQGGSLESLESEFKRVYPLVENGVKKAGFEGKEVHSKCGFARSAASTLRGFAKRGGDLNELDPATVTKRQLQPQVLTPKLQRTEDRLILSIRALAKTDEEAALEELETLMSSLRKLRKELSGSVRVVSHSLERQQPTAH